MTTIYHQVGIKVPLEKVYTALTTIDGLAKWWANNTRGNCLPGGTI